MRITTPQRILSIVGGAFLIGTGQAVLFGPVTLGPTSITEGSDGAKVDPNRVNKPDAILSEQIDDENAEESQDASSEPSATFTGGLDALLDAPVPDGTLTLREARTLWEEGAYFIDSRHDYEYEAGHIPYAFFLPAQMFDTDSDRAFAIVEQIPSDYTVVLYCVGGECDASKNTAAMLEQLGYTDLRIMGAGYDDWVAAGFEIETGSGVSP